jgi:hypothetical protein
MMTTHSNVEMEIIFKRFLGSMIAMMLLALLGRISESSVILMLTMDIILVCIPGGRTLGLLIGLGSCIGTHRVVGGIVEFISDRRMENVWHRKAAEDG